MTIKDFQESRGSLPQQMADVYRKKLDMFESSDNRHGPPTREIHTAKMNNEELLEAQETYNVVRKSKTSNIKSSKKSLKLQSSTDLFEIMSSMQGERQRSPIPRPSNITRNIMMGANFRQNRPSMLSEYNYSKTQEKRNLLDTTTKDQSSMFQQKSGTQNQTQGDMTAFSQNCKISIKNTTSRMSSSAFQDAVVCLQQNNKLIFYKGNYNPLERSKVKSLEIPEEKQYKIQYLQSLYNQGYMQQVNRDFNCFPICMLDLALLARGRIDRRIPDEYEVQENVSLVRISKTENYAQPEKATNMTIQVYKAIAGKKPTYPKYGS